MSAGAGGRAVGTRRLGVTTVAALLTRAGNRQLLTGGNPDVRFDFPEDADFVPAAWLEEVQGRDRYADDAPHRDYIPAPEIARIAVLLCGEHRALFSHLDNVKVEYRWRRRGGSSAGKATLGKCVKVGGLVKEFTDAAWVIWLGADTCAALGLTAYQVEALTFHELLHTEADDDDKPVPNPHDFEGFAKEIEVYGLWQHDLIVAGRAVQAAQLPLFAGVG